MPIKPDGRNCSKCGLFKLWSEYAKASCQKTGHRPSCLQCQRLQSVAYTAANREKINERGKRWSKENRAEARKREAVYKTRPEVKEKQAAYWRTPEFRLRATEKTMRRKALMKATMVEPVNYAAILQEHGRVCHLCSLPIGSDLDFDHVKPLAKGGAHVPSNIKPAHSSCNRSKRDKYAD